MLYSLHSSGGRWFVTIGSSILVVDDHVRLLNGIRLHLEAEGYQVLTALNGVEALDVLSTNLVDLILADIAMPRMNGYQLYEQVQQNFEWVRIPFVFLTARTMDSDIRYGKELGVDDYLTKPIELRDLLAVVRGKLRRARKVGLALVVSAPASDGSSPVLTAGELQIDTARHRVWMRQERIELSAREFALLAHLARKIDQVVCPQELVLETHGLETDRVDAGALLRPMIRSLRRRLGYPVGEMGCIENVRGVGYRLVPPGSQ